MKDILKKNYVDTLYESKTEMEKKKKLHVTYSVYEYN